jgi:hypothetical protein
MAEKKKPAKKKEAQKPIKKEPKPTRKEPDYKEKPRRYWNESDWEQWGKDFGKRAEAWSERAGSWGEDFGDRMERRGREFERRGKELEYEWKGRWHRTFGIMGPLFESSMGLVFLLIGIWIMNVVNVVITSNFVSLIANFLFNNIAIFFGASLVFNYAEYFERRHPGFYMGLSPLVMSAKITFGLWILGWILGIIGTSISSTTVSSISAFISTNLQGIFIALLVLGYVLYAMGMSWMNRRWGY